MEKEEYKNGEIKEFIKSIYEKYKKDSDKLDKIEKELKEISDFILSKKEEIKIKNLLNKINNK